MVAPFFVIRRRGNEYFRSLFCFNKEEWGREFELSLPCFCFKKAFCIFVKNILL